MPSKPPKKPLASTKRKATATAASAQPLPNWPALSPLVPSEDLHLDTLLDGQVIIIRNLFTSSLCHKYVQFLSSLPLVTTPITPKNGDAVRVNDRFEVQDSAFARRLWSETGLEGLVTGQAGAGDGGYGGARGEDGDEEEQEEVAKDVMGDLKTLWGGEVCGLNPRLRVYRYRKGQFFGQHYDESNLLTLSNNTTTTATTTRALTTWTLLIYLSSCTGGETVFYPDDPPLSSQKTSSLSSRPHSTTSSDPIVVAPEPGMALLHKHGLQDCLLHEGRAVLGGEKWVLRSDLCVLR